MKQLGCALTIILLLLSGRLSAQFIYPPLSGQSQPNEPVKGGEVVNLTPEMITRIRHMPFNDELFKTNYQLFLYNSNIQAAYQLALIAVEKDPKDLAWHERLAQAASWAGDYKTGMKELLYVAQHTNDAGIIKKAATDAKVLGFDDVLVRILNIYLAKNPDDTKEYIVLADAQNRLNQPEQALQTLRKINARHPTREAYVLTAGIFQDLEQWGNALHTWQYIDRQYGPGIDSVMAEAYIYYTHRNFNLALNALKPGIPIAKMSDTDFWETLGELAWVVNNRRLAILGYSRNVIDAEHYQRLIALEMKSNPGHAFAYSVKGWKRYSKSDFLSTALLLGGQLHKWRDTSGILASLSGKQLHEAQKLLFYWQAQENMYSYYGADDLRREVLVRGVLLQPELIQLKSDLLWLVMENGENQRIQALMDLWYQQGYWQDPLLWHAYAEGYDVLNEYNAAISMYQMHLFDDFQDSQVLIDYANLLDRAQLYEEAYYTRILLWHRLINKLKSSPSDRQTIEFISQIAPFFQSGTEQVGYLTDLLQQDVSDEDVNIILNWVVQRNYVDLVAYMKANYYNNNPLPDWAEINLALAKNDTTDLQRILAHKERQWTRGDRINAAVRMENIPQALDYAFNELTERPRASEIYEEFAQYGVADANYVSMDGDYEHFVNVAGPRTKLEARSRLTNEWKIIPYASVWALRSMDQQSITHVPGSDSLAGAKLYQVIHRGNITYNLGLRKAMSTFVPAAVDVNYLLDARWSANFKAGYNQENFENSYLRVGGVQDQAGMGVGYTYDNYTSIFLEGTGLRYYSQNRHYLAEGFDLSGLYQRKLWLSYPDYTLGLFADVHNFERDGSYGGNVTTLFPPPSGQSPSPSLTASNNAANYKNLIPDTYYEGGLTFSFGNAILDYTHAWRPYMWGSLYYNSITKISYDVKGGLNGSVFGRDSLLFYAEYGTAQTTPQQKNYTIGVRYLLYF